jgi:hypothetical protein
MSAAADLVFIIAGRVNIIVIKAGPIVAPVCARITNRPGAMAKVRVAAVTRHTLADCGTGLTLPTKFLFAIIGITAVGTSQRTLNGLKTSPSQKEREENKNKKAKGKNFLPHSLKIA